MNGSNDPLHRKKQSAIDALKGHSDLAQRLRALADEVEVVLHAGEELELIEIAEALMSDRQTDEPDVAEHGPAADGPSEAPGAEAEGAPGGVADDPSAQSDAPDHETWSLPWAQPAGQPWLAASAQREAS